jgi:hypothetical protein
MATNAAIALCIGTMMRLVRITFFLLVHFTKAARGACLGPLYLCPHCGVISPRILPRTRKPSSSA